MRNIRVLAGIFALVVFVLAIVYAVRTASVQGAALLFNSAAWLVWLAPFAGIIAAGLTKRKDPVIEGDRVLRHDDAAILEHWTHGIGTAVLLVTGIGIGLFFLPTMVGGGVPIWTLMNVHFVGVVLFLFGSFYYGANTLMATRRFQEHLPTKDAVDYTKRHYGLLLGFKKFTMPAERKYFESEKMAYVLALGATATVVVTGLVKVAAHSIGVPGAIMAIMTPLHDIATVAMLAFFLAHVFITVALPMSWPSLRSMFTGYMGLEHAKKEHAAWIEEIENGSGSPASADSSDSRDRDEKQLEGVDYV